MVKLLFEDWLPHDHNCVAGSPSRFDTLNWPHPDTLIWPHHPRD